MSLYRVAGVALETLGTLADEIAFLELAAVIEPSPHETLAERKERRQRIVGRLGEARIAIVATRDQLRRERELSTEVG